MFWNKAIKPPVTEDDKEWIEEALLFLQESFGKEYFKSLETILPNREFYDIAFSGAEEDAFFVLNQTKIYMDIDDSVAIRLKFYSESPVEMADGTILTTPAGPDDSWSGAAGLYEADENKTIISIERGQLKNPQSLIATIAHELSHHLLLGEGRIDDNDEYLTDMTVIALGFGIFAGNSRFSYSTKMDYRGAGWQTSSTGYLPEQVIAYAMAWLSVHRNEEPVWKNMLNADMLKYFNQSLEYIQKYPDKIRLE